MPNWCSTSIKFRGEPEAVKTLYDFVNNDAANDRVEEKSDFGTRWLGNYLIRAGFDYKSHRCRGSLDYLGNLCDNSFTIETETAWGPMLSMWQAIIDKIAPGGKIEYSATELGCQLYWTNDPAHIGNYWVDVYDHEELPENVAAVFEESGDYTAAALREALLKVFPNDSALDTDKLIEKLEELDVEDGMIINKWEYVPVSEVD